MVGTTRAGATSQKKSVYEAPTLYDIRPTLILLIPADAAIAAFSLYVAHLSQYRAASRFTELWQGQLWAEPSYSILLVISLPILLTALYFAGAYRWWSLRNAASTVIMLAKAVVLSAFVLIATALVLRDDAFWRDIVFIYAALAFTGALLIRLVIRHLCRLIYSHARWIRNTIIVGTGRTARAIAEVLSSRPHLGFKVVGYVSDPAENGSSEPDIERLGTIEDLPRLVDHGVVDAVMAGVPPHRSAVWQNALSLLGEVGTPVHVGRAPGAALLSANGSSDVVAMPFVTMSSAPSMDRMLAVKRAVDIVGAVLGLIVMAPLMLLTAAAVVITSPGPALYMQERVGLRGRRFQMWKFRSMHCDAEAQRDALAADNEADGPVFKMSDDPRVTWIGKWIRRTSIDELPQLWNVLVGDMSLVGPRPPLPDEVDLYDRWQRRRLAMRPGLTCLWQISGRSAVGFEAWMNLDMEYIDNWSLGLDLRILLRTIPAVITGRGAA